ncbi:MAG: hypothetical protein AUG49_21565 [Catenulispora sp. 13_1_20CM_3_70_7]|jgi:hypothetical protein|nr:MAG: hypothetical protein AUG49_21565 [Catenulispora sp. 13_1_20CM_3_70_7]
MPQTPSYFGPSTVMLSFYEVCVATVATALTIVCALWYLRHVRMERPGIGTFKGRDIAVLTVFLATLPLLYIHLPRVILTSFLAVTFTASISIGLKPLLKPAQVWLVVGGLIGLNIWLARTMLGTVLGWQIYWAEDAILVVLGAASVANLYVQGGMKLKHVASFALTLAFYDVLFTTAFPVTDALAEEFLGFPLDPSVGMRFGIANAALGLGDLLVYSLFFCASFKAYGRKGAKLAGSLALVFGVVGPSYAPLVVNVLDARGDRIIPAQAIFGPAAFFAYRWMRKHWGRERTMKEFLESDDVPKAEVIRAAAELPTPQPEAGQVPVGAPAAGS